jgi:hypothetical protein
MAVTMIRARVKPERVGEVEAAAAKLFSALEREQPNGIRYASAKLADGVSFVILLELADGTANPLVALPEFMEFQDGLKTQLSEPPAQEQLTVVGSYRLFS